MKIIELNSNTKDDKINLSNSVAKPLVSRSLANYRDVLEQMKCDEHATRVCLKMMTWLIKDIEIDSGYPLQEYNNIWEQAFHISLGAKFLKTKTR
jgi:hypothetical protein